MKVFTTGQVAKICKVVPRTVSKWIESGRLKHYRIPGSQDVRVEYERLKEFMAQHGLPLPDEMKSRGMVIEINLDALDPATTRQIGEVLAELAKKFQGGSWQDSPAGVFHRQRCVGQIYYEQLLQDRTMLNAPAINQRSDEDHVKSLSGD